MFSIPLFGALLISLIPWVSLASLDEKYSFKSVLHNRNGNMYVLHWKFSVEEKTITFAVNVSTPGWVGFGLSPNGGMVDSDVVIGWVKDGKAYFHVSFSSALLFLLNCCIRLLGPFPSIIPCFQTLLHLFRIREA